MILYCIETDSVVSHMVPAPRNSKVHPFKLQLKSGIKIIISNNGGNNKIDNDNNNNNNSHKNNTDIKINDNK